MNIKALIIPISALAAILLAKSWYLRLAFFLGIWFMIKIVYAILYVKLMSGDELKRHGDANELAALNEIVNEHVTGRFDHSNYLPQVIRDAERNLDKTPDVIAALKRARQVMGNDHSVN